MPGELTQYRSPSPEDSNLANIEEEDVQGVDSTFDGYPRLARLMSLEPQTAVFRQFGDLTMLNLLRLQAELHDLEDQLGEIRDEENQSGDPVRKGYVSDFKLMRDFVEDGDSVQYEHLVKIGKKLEEYHAALLQASKVAKLGAPKKGEVAFLRLWLQRDGMGNNFLRERERTMWNKREDLISLCQREGESDAFTTLLNGALLDIYHRSFGQRRKRNAAKDVGQNIRRYNEAHLRRIGNVIGATLSSLLPTLVILVLYFVQRMLI